MKKFLKNFLGTIAVLILLPIMLMLIWLTGNLHDEPLNPELSALLAQTHSTLPEADNAYFATLGLAAPADIEPHAWGVEWFKQAVENDAAALAGKPIAEIKLATLSFAPSNDKLPCGNKSAPIGCLDEVAAHPEITQQLLANEALLLHRFDALLDKNIAEPYRTTAMQSDIPARAVLMRASLLGVLRIALDMQQKHDERALTRWKNETVFLLRFAKNSHSLIDKMVLDAALVRYQKLLADYLSTHPKASLPGVLAMLEPFNHEAVSLHSAYENEALFSARVILAMTTTSVADSAQQASLSPLQSKFAMLFLDRNATANGLANWGMSWGKIAALQGETYRAAITQRPDEEEKSFWPLLSYHNPIGVFLVEVGKPNFATYLYRTDEVLANKQLLLFMLDARAGKVTAEKMAQEIVAQQTQLQHPYTGLLPVWDAQTHTLSYPKPDFIEAKNYAPLRIQM